MSFKKLKNYSDVFGYVCLSLILTSSVQKEAYRIFDKKGKNTDYENMLRAVAKADVIFFGELHNNPVCHWLQYELTDDLLKEKKGKLILGAEMFEADNQLIVNEYLKGLFSESKFKEEAKLWKNYKTDYQPLMELARENKLPFVATNIPRRYANMVYKGGFEVLDKLSPEAKSIIAPLPIAYDPELKGYKDMLAMGGGHGGENLPKAQAIKDATMAYFIHKNKTRNKTFLHYNGAYHSNNFEGIIWYLEKLDRKLKVVTISTVEQENIQNLDEQSENLADFIIVVPANMTKTY